MAFGSGIKLSTGFDLGSQMPLDSRTIFANKAEMDAFGKANPGKLPKGLVVTVQNTLLQYVWSGTEFIECLKNSFDKNKSSYDGVLTWDNLVKVMNANGFTLAKGTLTAQTFSAATVNADNLDSKTKP